MSTPALATLRDALTAARPAMTGEQQDAAARDLPAEPVTPVDAEASFIDAVTAWHGSTDDDDMAKWEQEMTA